MATFDPIEFIRAWKRQVGVLYYCPNDPRWVGGLYRGVYERTIWPLADRLWRLMKSTDGAEAAVIAAILASPSKVSPLGWSVA